MTKLQELITQRIAMHEAVLAKFKKKQKVHESLTGDVLRDAQNPPSSTSHMSNLVDQYRIAAKASILDPWTFQAWLNAEATEVKP